MKLFYLAMADNIFDRLKKRLQPEKQADQTQQNPEGAPLGDVFGKSDPVSTEKSKKDKTEEILSKTKGLGVETPIAETPKPQIVQPKKIEEKKPGKILEEKKPEPKKPEIKVQEKVPEKPIAPISAAPEKKASLFEFSKNEPSKNEKNNEQKNQKQQSKDAVLFEKSAENVVGSITVIDKSAGKVVMGETRSGKAGKKYFDKQGGELELYERKKETEAMVAYELFDDRVEKKQFRKSESNAMNIAIVVVILVSVIILAVIWFNVF